MVNPKIKDCREYIENAEDPQVAGSSLIKSEAAAAVLR
jgi:hypothetical protein